MHERGLTVAQTTVWRWVQKYAPEINKRSRQHLKLAGASYHVAETYIKVGKSCKYLYHAVDKEGNTIEFMLSAKWDVSAAKRFFKKMIRPAIAVSSTGSEKARCAECSKPSPKTLKSAATLIYLNALLTARLWSLKKGTWSGKDQAGQRHEAHGGGRQQWFSCLRLHGVC